jgi:hypothetical protein
MGFWLGTSGGGKRDGFWPLVFRLRLTSGLLYLPSRIRRSQMPTGYPRTMFCVVGYFVKEISVQKFQKKLYVFMKKIKEKYHAIY